MFLRIGHKGADAITPGNTLESFAAAIEAGVDAIEFDVLRPRSDFPDGADWREAQAGPAPGGEPLLIAHGTLERREGTTNILVSWVGRLERPDLPIGEVRHIEPRRIWSNDEAGDRLRDGGDLRAVVPAAHSFGRRG